MFPAPPKLQPYADIPWIPDYHYVCYIIGTTELATTPYPYGVQRISNNDRLRWLRSISPNRNWLSTWPWHGILILRPCARSSSIIYLVRRRILSHSMIHGSQRGGKKWKAALKKMRNFLIQHTKGILDVSMAPFEPFFHIRLGSKERALHLCALVLEILKGRGPDRIFYFFLIRTMARYPGPNWSINGKFAALFSNSQWPRRRWGLSIPRIVHLPCGLGWRVLLKG